MAAQAAFLITGIPGAGKTTVARMLAQRLPRAAHIEADLLQQMIVSGGFWPGEQPEEEAEKQLVLRATNAALLANSFASEGFIPVIDDVIVSSSRLDLYQDRITVRPLHLVVLAPPLKVVLERDRDRGYKHVGDRWTHLDAHQREQLRNHGVWIDTESHTPDETAEQILTALT